MTTDQILLGASLTLMLAVGCQILASRLRIPALIVLLPVGFAAWALTSEVNPTNLLGSLFEPLVSLAVAVILFDSGLQLDLASTTLQPNLDGPVYRVPARNDSHGVVAPYTGAESAVPDGHGLLFLISSQRPARRRDQAQPAGACGRRHPSD